MLYFNVIKKECDVCILISGDADFIPALDLINTCGGKVFSSSLIMGYSSQLREGKYQYKILSREIIKKYCLRF